MAKKRIIATVTNDLSYDRRMIRICSALAADGYNVLLVGRKLPESIDLVEQPFSQHRIQCYFRKGILFYAEYNLRLFQFLLKQRFEIGNSTDADTLLAVGLVCKIKNKIHVHDAHEYFTQVPELVNRKLVQWVWSQIEHYFIPKVQLAYTVSQSIADVYSNSFKVNFAVIRNVPPLLKLVMPETVTENKIIYQGALNKGRGLEALITAMQNINGTLEIVGDGDITNDLHQLTHQLKLENKVTFLGMVSPDKLADITIKAKVGVNLCENLGLNYYFALSNKGFDYIHAYLPAVTNNFPEYIKLNDQFETMCLTDCNANDISLAINKLLNDNAYYNKLRNNCLIAREELNWQKESAKLKELYAKI